MLVSIAVASPAMYTSYSPVLSAFDIWSFVMLSTKLSTKAVDSVVISLMNVYPSVVIVVTKARASVLMVSCLPNSGSTITRSAFLRFFLTSFMAFMRALSLTCSFKVLYCCGSPDFSYWQVNPKSVAKVAERVASTSKEMV